MCPNAAAVLTAGGKGKQRERAVPLEEGVQESVGWSRKEGVQGEKVQVAL